MVKRNPNKADDFLNEKPYNDIDQKRKTREIDSGKPEKVKNDLEDIAQKYRNEEEEHGTIYAVFLKLERPSNTVATDYGIRSSRSSCRS